MGNYIPNGGVKNHMLSFAVYGNLDRLKFFWPYLANKNPKIENQYETTPFDFVIFYGLSDVANFMRKQVSNDRACVRNMDRRVQAVQTKLARNLKCLGLEKGSNLEKYFSNSGI